MPVRFQVDGDFYDHPKTIGMSPEAYKLWTRAGSYSVNKLTDGLITEDVLAEVLREPRTAADELVKRRLWRRVKGGWRFHQYEERNLTKQRVQDDQKADRIRKRERRQAERESARNAAGQNAKPKVEPGNVRAESGRNPDGIRAESERIPDGSVSVSVSVSESVSGSGRGAEGGHPPSGEPPPPTCPKHIDDPDPPPCRPCGKARLAREAWDEEHERLQRIADQTARSQAARDRAEATRKAIESCNRCNHLGQLDNVRACNHQPEASPDAAAAARNVARAAARRPGRPNPATLDEALAEVIPLHHEEPTQ